MTWVKLDDQMPEHPKLVRLPPTTKWLFVEILCYCNRYLTDGFITADQVRRLDATMHGDSDATGRQHSRSNGGSNVSARGAALQAAGLLHPVAGGYQVHDYAVYQPTRADVLRQLEEGKRRAKSSYEERKKNGRLRAKRGRSSPDPARPELQRLPSSPEDSDGAGARPSGGSRPTPIAEVLEAGRMRLKPDHGPPLDESQADDLDPPDDEAEP